MMSSFESATRLERATFISVCVAAAISLAFSIAGFPVLGHDADVLLNWLYQFPHIFEHGIAYPRWFPASNGGFGSPSFYFYPPLPYWFACFLHQFIPFVPSPFGNLIELIATVGSLLTSWLLLKRYTDRKIILWTGILTYSFLTYRFGDVFVRAALGEQWGITFLPLLFIRFRDPIRSIALLAITWSAIVLCSIPMTVLGGVSVLVALLVRKDHRWWIEQVSGGLIASLVCAIYLVPATFLRPYIHAEHLWDMDLQTTNFAILDLFMHRGWLRFLTCATLFAGAIALYYTRANRRNNIWWWIGAIAVFVQIPIFYSLWHLPQLSFVQFSWRWAAILLLVIAVFVVRYSTPALQYAIIAMAVITVFCEVRLSQDFIGHPRLPYDRYLLDAPEYHTKWTQNDLTIVRSLAHTRMDDPAIRLMGLTAPGDSVTLLSATVDRRTYGVHLMQSAPVQFHQFYWPYWKAFRDTTSIETKPDPNGLAIAQLPAGDYRLSYKLVESKPEKLGRTITIIGLILLVGIVAAAAYREITMRLEATSGPLDTRTI